MMHISYFYEKKKKAVCCLARKKRSIYHWRQLQPYLVQSEDANWAEAQAAITAMTEQRNERRLQKQ